MSDAKVYPVPAAIAASAHLDDAKYQSMYRQSIDTPDEFWAAQADEFVSWF